jgi:uncharacterized linocin/CFP29 family protein
MKFLNRESSPIAPAVWSQIDAEFTTLLSQRLKLRSAVDFVPVSFETDSVATGSLKPLSSKGGVAMSARVPLPMVEICYDFEMPKAVIEEFKRDKPNFDNTVFKNAANTFSGIENTLILDGLKSAAIEGILTHIPHKPIKTKDTKGLIDAVSSMIAAFAGDFVAGPYKLVLSTATLIKMVGESEGGVSIKDRLEAVLGANFFVVCEAIGNDKILALSTRGGDFALYNGLDVSIGYSGEESESYKLFMMESATFRVINPEAALIISL